MTWKGRSVKAHKFWDTTADMKHHVIPFLCKEPRSVIIHAVTIDALCSSSREILDKPLMVKSFITDNLPKLKFVISTPTLCTDDGKAASTLSQITKNLLELGIDITDNKNINARNLGNKGFYLNPKSTTRIGRYL